MTDLSPAAAAVLKEFEDSWDADPYEMDVRALGAALRVAADQVVPHEYLVGIDVEVKTRQLTRLRLLAIAAELENTNV